MGDAGKARPGRPDPDFQVQVRVEGVTALANLADDLPAGHFLPGFDRRRFLQMGI